MEEFKRTPHDSLIEEAIRTKGPGYSDASARTFRTDSLAILEALVAEVEEAEVAAALERQGFRPSASYLTTLRSLRNRSVAAAALTESVNPQQSSVKNTHAKSR